jgi:hypothetical protein
MGLDKKKDEEDLGLASEKRLKSRVGVVVDRPSEKRDRQITVTSCQVKILLPQKCGKPGDWMQRGKSRVHSAVLP